MKRLSGLPPLSFTFASSSLSSSFILRSLRMNWEAAMSTCCSLARSSRLVPAAFTALAGGLSFGGVVRF